MGSEGGGEGEAAVPHQGGSRSTRALSRTTSLSRPLSSQNVCIAWGEHGTGPGQGLGTGSGSRVGHGVRAGLAFGYGVQSMCLGVGLGGHRVWGVGSTGHFEPRRLGPCTPPCLSPRAHLTPHPNPHYTPHPNPHCTAPPALHYTPHPSPHPSPHCTPHLELRFPLGPHHEEHLRAGRHSRQLLGRRRAAAGRRRRTEAAATAAAPLLGSFPRPGTRGGGRGWGWCCD